ncbi:MAG: hypothetical protein R3F14_17690 [Polyangiaceae bacterium]
MQARRQDPADSRRRPAVEERLILHARDELGGLEDRPEIGILRAARHQIQLQHVEPDGARTSTIACTLTPTDTPSTGCSSKRRSRPVLTAAVSHLSGPR